MEEAKKRKCHRPRVASPWFFFVVIAREMFVDLGLFPQFSCQCRSCCLCCCFCCCCPVHLARPQTQHALNFASYHNAAVKLITSLECKNQTSTAHTHTAANTHKHTHSNTHTHIHVLSHPHTRTLYINKQKNCKTSCMSLLVCVCVCALPAELFYKS